VIRNLVRSVIHNATVTNIAHQWPVALRLDPAIMRAAELVPLEIVEIMSLSTVTRFRTYVQPGDPGEVTVFTTHEHHVSAGDVVSILTYSQLHAGQSLDHRAKLVTLDPGNHVIAIADATTQF